VIQIEDLNEEVKVYDMETAVKFTMKKLNGSCGVYSFADFNDPIDD